MFKKLVNKVKSFFKKDKSDKADYNKMIYLDIRDLKESKNKDAITLLTDWAKGYTSQEEARTIMERWGMSEEEIKLRLWDFTNEGIEPARTYPDGSHNNKVFLTSLLEGKVTDRSKHMNELYKRTF